MGSCNGCRVLRKGCGNTCVLRPCLEWIQSPDSQGHATLFLSKFFGRSDLINFISSAPPGHRRTELFRSLLYEAVGRTLNPINGAMGLLSTGNWDLCEAAVRTVLAGGTPTPLADGILIPEVDESSEVFKAQSARWTMMMNRNQIDAAGTSNAIAPPNVVIAEDSDRDLSTKPADDVAVDVLMSFRRGDGGDPKLLKLFG
ncbi:LOB domain-containing protein 39-like [Cynara cardunculus var. scolymus]|uniref:Lateral organ boundaries domain-containing protein n=1 Tax=Cynara cardunculus var. scolymus TaxID=59895 RepID=A0A118JYS8_CYNCS|nr:LOB domain-containing protein 39-like [Cynara cardunculus var. scolymus]KVH98287.1 lateral organ boundaries domain-containing protein [Cynara cardunculus var. scolymus]